MSVDPKKNIEKPAGETGESLETQAPIGERDEVKKAEERTRKIQENSQKEPGKKDKDI